MQIVRWFRLLSLLAVSTCTLRMCAAQKDTWVEVKSPHFVAYSDAGEAEARRALMGFEGIRSVFDTIFPGIRVDPPKPMIVLVTENETSMKRFLPEAFSGKDPKRPSGMFQQGFDRNYAILRLDIDTQVDQPYFVLFHEYTHSILHQNFPSFPIWLDEGIADFYGATEIRSERVYIGRVPVERLQKLRSSGRLPLETLLAVTHDSPNYQEGEKTGIFYAQSWAFVHYLFMDEQAKKKGLFPAYLKALSRGGDPVAAALSAFGDLNQMQEALAQYSRRPNYLFWNLPLAVKLVDKDFQVRRLDPAEALVIRAEFLQQKRKEMESGPLLEQALALAPGRPEVHAALGQGFLNKGEHEKARLAFETSLRQGSRDFRVPYQLARLAQDGHGDGTTDAAQILAWLETARTWRPDFAAVHMALCRQYSRDPREPAKALQSGMTALEWEPQNLIYRVNLGYACMDLGLEKEAKAIGEQLNQMAATREEMGFAESYSVSLARFLERGKAQALMSGHPVSDSFTGQGLAGPSVAPLKFSLSSHLAPLGQEVMRLVAEGKANEAVPLVEKAIAAVDNAYDRKTLRSLLDTLRRRIGQTGG